MLINVGPVDARIRGALAVITLVVAALLNHMPVLSLTLAVVALVLMGTALTKYCPIYRVLGIDTAGPHHARKEHL